MTVWDSESRERAPADLLATNSGLMNAARTGLYAALRLWLRSCWGYRVEGAEILRRTGNAVLIANHSSHVDTVALLAALPARVRNRCYSAAAEDYFYGNPFRQLPARLFANTFPFRRQGADARLSLEACGRILARGDSLLLFPEGTRSVDGRLQRFRKGIGLLVQGTPHPVIPVGILGTSAVMGKGQWFPGPGRITLRVGEPVRFAEAGRDDETAIAIANELHDRVARLIGADPSADAPTAGDSDE